MNADIFRAYDIRGLYPSDLNEETAYKIGAALADKITTNRKGSCSNGWKAKWASY